VICGVKEFGNYLVFEIWLSLLDNTIVNKLRET